jgi:tellurite resistance protein TerC
VPVVLGTATDLFLVDTPNVFVILGLRALCFLRTGAVARLQYLDKGLPLVLAFIGGKMVIPPRVHIPVRASLGVVFVILGGTVTASLISKPPASKVDCPRAG